MPMAIMGARLRRAAARLRSTVGSLGIDAQAGSLILVTGGGEWAVKEIALALQRELQPHFPAVVIVQALGERPYLSRANIHGLCRPAFFNSDGIPPVHPSNRLVVSWLHGGKRSADPHVAAACTQLERHWRKVRQFIVPNKTTYQAVLECGVDPGRLHIIPNGVNTQAFRPAADETDRRRIRHALGLSDEVFVIGSFQRDSDEQGHPKLVKGPDTLVEALAAVHHRRPIAALLTGPGRVYVQQRLHALDVPHVHASVSQATDLPAMYHAIDAYLISSREEGGPATLRESMASGVPVVSTRMGLAADLIDHGRNGLLAEVGDAHGLAKGLLQLIEEPALRRQVAREALETIRPLDYAVIARRYQEEVYRMAFQ